MVPHYPAGKTIALLALQANAIGNQSQRRTISWDMNYKGYTHHASEDDPQYEIKSDRTDHIAMHKGRALTKRI